MQDRRFTQALGEQVVVAASGHERWIPCSRCGRGPGHEYNVDTEASVPRSPELHAVSCVLENLDVNGLGRVLLERDVGSAAQTFVDPVWIGRGDRMMAWKSSRYLHQSSGMVCIEAVIKMIPKGRSPTMRHVSRTHRVALDWLFDRISLGPKI